jgi:hypothetical protein
METQVKRPRWIPVVAVVAVLFGLLTLKSGGLTLFVDGPDRAAAGNYVPFVLWFNFLAGFVYIIAGFGLFLWRKWAISLAMTLFVATLVVFIGLGAHIWFGGLYELRTVKAMILRTSVWMVIAFLVQTAWKRAQKDSGAE